MGDGAEKVGERGPVAAAGDAAEWFYDDGTEPRGPFTLRAIGQMARAGVVGADVPVARDGAGGWRPLSEVTGRPPERRAPAVLPEEEGEAGGTVFRVHLGGLRVPSSRMGFVWGGTLRLGDDGTLDVSGRKLWGGGIRFLGGLVSLIVLVPLAAWAIASTVGFAGGFLAGLIGRLVPSGGGGEGLLATVATFRDYVLEVTGWLIAGLALVAAVAIPMFVAGRCMAGKGRARFTIPEGAVVSRKGATVTMPLTDGDRRPIRAARMTFSGEADAARFVGAITGDPGQG